MIDYTITLICYHFWFRITNLRDLIKIDNGESLITYIMECKRIRFVPFSAGLSAEKNEDSAIRIMTHLIPKRPFDWFVFAVGDVLVIDLV